MPYAISATLILLVWLAIVGLNERYQLLSCDRFPTPLAKYGAYAWLGAFLLLLALMVTSAALSPATSEQLSTTPFYSIFLLHGILIVFLAGWWLLSGRPPLREFLNIRHERPAEVVAIGVSVGVGGWVVTIVVAMVIALILTQIGLLKETPEQPAMISWLAALPIWKKVLIVLSAMTIEEAFFRSFLQKRIGLIASTVLFALAHFTYGNPLLLIGVTVVSTIIGLTFYRTKNVIPGVVAHGVFDSIQIFVLIPLALRLMGAGA